MTACPSVELSKARFRSTTPNRVTEDWADAIAAALIQREGRRTARALERAREHDWSWVLEQFSRRYLKLVRQGRTAPAAESVEGDAGASTLPS